MSAATILGRGRAVAEGLMVDTCLIRRSTSVVTDDLTGQVTPIYATVYTGRCKVQTPSAGGDGRRVDVGEVAVVVLRPHLHLPVVGSESVRRGDEVSITAGTNDTALTGRTWLVRDEMTKTYATARRLILEEVT